MRRITIAIGYVVVLSCLVGSLTAQQPVHSDNHLYPIDNRKPCHICSRPNDCKVIPRLDLPGLRGRPHIDQDIGGCTCGKKGGDRHPMKSWNWSQPFSAIRDCKTPGLSAWLDDPCRPRMTDAYDQLGNFRLINYQRTDTGYCGPGRDPFGCLGESRQMQSNVRGLQFRQPGVPAFGSPRSAQPPAPHRPTQEIRSANRGGYDLEAYRKR